LFLKTTLKRLGWKSTMIITGDADQTDLLPGMSGLGPIVGRLSAREDGAAVRLEEPDIRRYPMFAAMLTVL
jgi:phosphate starvation-inducible PhoH-like protein